MSLIKITTHLKRLLNVFIILNISLEMNNIQNIAGDILYSVLGCTEPLSGKELIITV